jgi:RNA polymerase sigma-70 factor, ECF subfamily
MVTVAAQWVVGAAQEEPAPVRLGTMFASHGGFIARSLRRMGVLATDVEDATQEVFVVAACKLDQIGVGMERSFLFGTAMRIAADARRSQAARQRRDASDEVDAQASPSLATDELVERSRARQALDRILETMPFEVRTVFALFELEGLTMAEIAELTGARPGTVASRLRRGRELFHAGVERARAAGGEA